MRWIWILLLAGCAEALPHYSINVRALEAPSPPVVVDEAGPVFTAVALTSSNWRGPGGAVIHVTWREINQETFNVTLAHSLPTLAGQPAAPTLQHTDDLSLVPLPAFRVRLSAQGGHALSLAGARIELEDDRGHRYAALSRVEIEREVLADAVARHPDLTMPVNEPVLHAVRKAIWDLPLVEPSRTLAAGEDFEGYVAFKLEARDAADLTDFVRHAARLRLHVSNVTVEGVGAREWSLAFAVARKRSTVVCSSGVRVPSFVDCPPGPMPDERVEDGPCIQHTKIPYKLIATQYWIGSSAVANSDLNRTLMQHPATQRLTRSGIVLRGVGYGVIALGVAAVAPAAIGFSARFGSDYGVAGVSFLGISLVGVGLVVLANRRADQAIRIYNEQSETTGICSPVW